MTDILNKKIRETSIADALAFYSGFTSENQNNPLLYAHFGGFIVVGRGFKEEFKRDELEIAIEFFKSKTRNYF